MKALLDFIGIFILGAILMFALNIGKIRDQAFDSMDQFEKQVGKQLVIQNDTFLIIDYSWVHSTFTLSDGRIISYKLVNDSTLIK